MPRPELRNHGVGWMRAVERLRNGGVPRNPVFLMPATHCTHTTLVTGLARAGTNKAQTTASY